MLLKIFIVAILLIAPVYAEKLGKLEIPLASVPYEVKITANLYSSPRTLIAVKKVTLPPDRDKLVVDFSDQNIEQANLKAPYVELVSHLIKGDNRFYLSDLLKKCEDGTPHGECNPERKFCQKGNLIDNCKVCGCPSGSCKLDGSCTQTFSSKLTCRQTTKEFKLFSCAECKQDEKKEKCRSIIPGLYFETTCTREYETACSLNPTCGSDELLKSEYCAICGNAVCDAQAGETCKSCSDCGSCPVPSTDIKAEGQDSLTVPQGSSATLSWTSQNADKCKASGAWAGNKPLSGSESTGAITSPKTYTLTCSSIYDDKATDSVTINTFAPAFCGDSACNGAETCSVCPGDCGSCPPKQQEGASGYATLTCKSDWKFVEELCVSKCDDDCEKKYDSQYGSGNVKSVGGGFCGTLFNWKWKCKCFVKETTTVSCSLNPKCPSSHPNLASSTQCTLTCADGTPYGQCTSAAPKYCDNGNIVNRASICGCPSGYQREGENCVRVPFCGDGACNAGESCSSCSQDCGACPIQKCSDGTPFGACSSTKPKRCENGNLVDRAGTCGCPSGYQVSGDSCIGIPDFSISSSGVRSSARGDCAIPRSDLYNSVPSTHKRCVWDTTFTETGTDGQINIESRTLSWQSLSACSGSFCSGSQTKSTSQIQSDLGFSTTIPVDSSILWCNEWLALGKDFTWSITESITGSGKTRSQTLTC